MQFFAAFAALLKAIPAIANCIKWIDKNRKEAAAHARKQSKDQAVDDAVDAVLRGDGVQPRSPGQRGEADETK